MAVHYAAPFIPSSTSPLATQGANVDVLHFAGPNLGVGKGPVDDVKERGGECPAGRQPI